MFIVLNKSHGVFNLSENFTDIYPEYKFIPFNHDSFKGIRKDNTFIQRLRDFGIGAANGRYSNLVITSIPNDVTDWRIREDDGYEYVEYVRDGKIYDA